MVKATSGMVGWFVLGHLVYGLVLGAIAAAPILLPEADAAAA
jgi:hypothetical protein